MAIGKDRAVLGHLRTLYDVGAIRELSDGQLLERFATERGERAELAFAALVERHGPMVLRVCRGVLADSHDAQDAFQATFLVLVKKARALWVHDSLGPWLRQVACRTAMCARRAAARRRRHERAAAVPSERQASLSQELEWAIHEEIDRLPRSFRTVVVLCDLGGRTHEQAARHLGCAIGTVKSRLSRARDHLRKRLRRRGLGPDSGLVAALSRLESLSPAVPAALLQATTTASMTTAAGRTFLQGPAVTLAQGVLRSMIITRCLKAAAFLFVAGATAFGVDSARGLDGPVDKGPAPGALVLAQAKGDASRTETAPAAPGEGKTAGDVKVVRAEPGTLTLTTKERGVVEPARSSEVFCMIEGGSTILWLAPEGTRVKKGDVVCELDSAALRDQLTNQIIATEGARAAYHNAELAREVAEIALVEYENGVFKHELNAIQRQIGAAESGVRTAQTRLERTRKARQQMTRLVGAKGPATPAEVVAELDVDDRLDNAEQALARETLGLEDAKSKLEVLTRFTKGKTIKELRGEVEKARSAEMVKKAGWQRESKKQAALEAQIQACKILAPTDGSVVLARTLVRSFGDTAPIDEGMIVRQRQKLLSVIDLDGPLRVAVKVPQSIVGKVHRGLRTSVRVDPFPNSDLTGVVEDVSPLPDPVVTDPDHRVYTSHILVENRLPGMRPGMTAEADIPFDEIKDVISVPFEAVVSVKTKHGDSIPVVLVRVASGSLNIRHVDLGAGDGRRIEIKNGLRGGEDVVVNPLSVMSMDQILKRLRLE